MLAEVRPLNVMAPLHRAGGRLFLAEQHPDQRCLSRTIRSNKADAVATLNNGFEVCKQCPVAK